VRVKKASSQQRFGADINTRLEKGYFVQTGRDGVAHTIFSKGRNAVLKPDSLIVLEPANMSLMMAKVPRSTGLDFSWSSVSGAATYRLQVSSSLIISNFLADKRKTGLMSVQISGLDEGTCYWMFSSMETIRSERLL